MSRQESGQQCNRLQRGILIRNLDSRAISRYCRAIASKVTMLLSHECSTSFAATALQLQRRVCGGTRSQGVVLAPLRPRNRCESTSADLAAAVGLSGRSGHAMLGRGVFSVLTSRRCSLIPGCCLCKIVTSQQSGASALLRLSIARGHRQSRLRVCAMRRLHRAPPNMHAADRGVQCQAGPHMQQLDRRRLQRGSTTCTYPEPETEKERSSVDFPQARRQLPWIGP